MQGVELLATARHRQSEPPRLISTLHGELDWIVLKALEKDRQRRYQTANGLGMDAKRYLANEPVSACPPSRIYRLQKLVRRNQIVFAAGAAVVLALVSGLGVSTWMFLREREARNIAVEAKQQESRLREAAERGRTNEMLLRQEAESREKIIQAAVLLRNNRFEEADRLIAQIPPNQQTMEGAAVFRSLGEWHALRGEWKPASERFAVLLRANQSEEMDSASLDFSAQAPALIMTQDRAGYDLLRQELMRRFADVSDPQVAERLLKNSLLLPSTPEMLAGLKPHAEYLTTYVNAMNATYPSKTAWQYSALGLFYYRQGEFAKGTNCCRKCLDYKGPEGPISPRPAAANLILAMCEYQQGQMEAAHTHFDAGNQIIQSKLKSGIRRGDGFAGYWFDWVVAQILRDEAGSLLEKS
jgi:hypothetical protein